MSCSNIDFSKEKLCAADLTRKIVIKRRAGEYTSFGSTQPELSFVDVATKRCAVKTSQYSNSGEKTFDGVNVENQTTHQFYFRRDRALEPFNINETLVLFDDRLFTLSDVSFPNEGDVTVLNCRLRGEGNASWA